MKINLKQRNGITLIALVITIVVLLILAGVTIAMLTGENGILGKATTAKAKSAEEEAREKVNLMLSEWRMENAINGISLDDFLTDSIYEKNRKAQGIESVDKTEEYYIATVIIGGENYYVIINKTPEIIEVSKSKNIMTVSFSKNIDYTFTGNIELTVTANPPDDGTTVKSIELIEGTVVQSGEFSNTSRTFTINSNGTYKFKITDSNNKEKKLEYTVNSFLSTPEIEARASGNAITINVKNNYPSNANVKYKYTVGTETTEGIGQTTYTKEGLTIGNKYKVKVHAYINNEENGADSVEQEIEISIEKPKINAECTGLDKITVNVETEYSSDENVMFEYYIDDQKQGDKTEKKSYTFESLKLRKSIYYKS